MDCKFTAFQSERLCSKVVIFLSFYVPNINAGCFLPISSHHHMHFPCCCSWRTRLLLIHTSCRIRVRTSEYRLLTRYLQSTAGQWSPTLLSPVKPASDVFVVFVPFLIHLDLCKRCGWLTKWTWSHDFLITLIFLPSPVTFRMGEADVLCVASAIKD